MIARCVSTTALVIAMGGCATFSGTAWADAAPTDAQAQTGATQGPTAAPTGTGIEDIVVTARRRSENLQSVPVAASAFSAQTLARRSITDIRAFAQSVPSLTIAQSGSSASAAIVNIRGQEGSNIAMAFDPAVGIYIDEVYLARSLGNQLSNLNDVEGVEVLRGVQGTLFGRNNTGGAIIIRPNKPDLENFAASGLISYGSYNQTQVQGMVNVPIVDDRIGLRVAGNWLRRDGFQRAPNAGPQDFGDRNRGGGRISLRAKPTDTLTLDLAYDISRLSERGQLTTTFATPDFYRYSNAGYKIAGSHGTGQGVTAKILQDFGSVQVKGIFGYRWIHFLDRGDIDASPSPSLDVYQFKKQHQFTAELNTNAKLYSGDGWFNSLDLTAGLFYFQEAGEEPRRTPTTSTTSVGVIQNGDANNRSKAAYAQLEGKLFGKLAIFAGGRYTKDNRRYTAQIIANGFCATIPGAPLSECFRRGVADFGYWSFTAGARYNFTSQAQVYAKISRGNRSGGLDNNTALPFKPEVNNEIETGLKADWFNHSLRTNLALYRNKFTNIQRAGLQIINNIPTSTVSNAASAEIKGIEFEGTLVPVHGLTLSGTFGYTDAHYKSYLVPQANGTILDLTDAFFQDVPKWTYSLSAEYVAQTGAGEISARADWGWRAKTWLENTSDPVFVQRPYGVLNARLGFAPENKILGAKMTFALFATNLTNRRYITGATRFGPGVGIIYPTSEPRIIGVEAGVKF